MSPLRTHDPQMTPSFQDECPRRCGESPILRTARPPSVHVTVAEGMGGNEVEWSGVGRSAESEGERKINEECKGVGRSADQGRGMRSGVGRNSQEVQDAGGE